jgi:S1/P1 nuclease
MPGRSRFTVTKYVLLCAVVILVAPIHGSAWGDIGHRIVARIASRYLNPQARAAIVDLLRVDSKLNPSYYSGSCPDVLQLANKTVLTDAEAATFTERGLACIASWADPPLKKARLYTSNWHFVDIPVNLRGPNGPVLSSFEVARECRMNDKYGDCAFLALKRLDLVVANQKELAGSRAEALKFIVHIIGDLHQPLHCITDKTDPNNVDDHGDVGGNKKIVQFNVLTWAGNANKDVNPRWGDHWNLHSVWDEGLIDAYMNLRHLTEDSYVTEVLKPLVQTPGDLAQLQSGDLEAWMKESYSIAIKNAYNLPPFDSTYQGYILQPTYFEMNHDVVNKQLLVGGVRLAAFLNKTAAH